MYLDHDDLGRDLAPLDGASAMLARVILFMLAAAAVIAAIAVGAVL